MGLDITYVAGEDRLSFRLPPSEIDILTFLKKEGFKKEVKAIFGVDDFGKQTEVKHTAIMRAVSRLIKNIKNNHDILPYIYSYKEEIPRGSGIYSTGTFVSSGFHIDGIPHCLEVGLEKCELSKLRQDDSGKWKPCDTVDVRNMKVIKIDEKDFSGDITIRKTRKPTKLLRNLEQLQSFLSKTKVKTISKIMG